MSKRYTITHLHTDLLRAGYLDMCDATYVHDYYLNAMTVIVLSKKLTADVIHVKRTSKTCYHVSYKDKMTNCTSAKSAFELIAEIIVETLRCELKNAEDNLRMRLNTSKREYDFIKSDLEKMEKRLKGFRLMFQEINKGGTER